MKFGDYPAPAHPPRCAHPCEECALRTNPAFLAVAADEVRTIQSFRSGTRVVEAGGVIVGEDRPSAQLFTLYSGWAFRYKSLSDGRRQSVAHRRRRPEWACGAGAAAGLSINP